jgi:hypothetical protein
MKKITLLTIVAITVVLFTNVNNNRVNSKSSGAPAGNAGNPSAGNSNCYTSCHNETVANLPSSQGGVTLSLNGVAATTGYYPDSTYTVTSSISVTANGHGFQTTAESASGFAGTFMAGSGNKITGTNYVTHTSPITSTPASWSYKWKAPSAGKGTVTFYSAFMTYNIHTYLSTTAFTELANPGGTTGLNEVDQVSFSIFPNPATSVLNFSASNLSANSSVEIYNLDGKLMLQSNIINSQNKSVNIADLNAGVYFVKIISGNKTSVVKLIKQ